MEAGYLSSIGKQFAYYKSLGEKAMEQLSDEGLFWRYNEASNSVAVIVQHLAGNMLSRFTDFLHSDGEKPWRHRDSEFEDTLASRQAVIDRWEQGWRCLFDQLDSLREADLSRIVYIRNDGHTVLEALNRQLAHYPYHIGQMVFAAKLLQGEQWMSLSIPKNRSTDYNDRKFTQPKDKRHFTDDL